MEKKEKLQDKLHDETTSAFTKYRQVVSGDTNLWCFLRYELIVFFLGFLPGAFGLFLRKIFYPFLFRSVGRGVVFGRNIILRHPHKVVIGDNVVIDEGCLIDAKGCTGKGIEIGNEVIISRNSSVIGKYGSVRIGDRTNIGTNCLFGSMGHVEVGKDTLFAANCYVGGGMYKMDRTDIPVVKQGSYTRGPVKIGDGCWLGAGAVVIDGVVLGRDVVLGAGAVATKDLPDFAIAAGVPARLIRIRGKI
ncbi:MAG: acyltransferase [Candidatus Theseobacter exili]|nr:acyltransferase [Candidatus Theseobacter exili]